MATGQTHGRGASVYLSAYNIGGDLNDVGIDITANNPEVTAFGDTFVNRSGCGIRDWTMTHAGYYNDQTTTASPGLEHILKDAISTACSVEIIFQGAAVSNLGYAGEYPTADYSISTPVDGVVTLTSTYTGSGGLYRVFDLSGDKQSGCTASASAQASVDTGGSLTANHNGFLRVWAGSATGTGSLVVKVQHSGDDTTFSDLITFTTATGSTAEIKNVTSASRYIRSQYNVLTGGCSADFTWHVSFGRRISN